MKLWSSFQDELLLTGVLIGVTVIASFWLTSELNSNAKTATLPPEPTQTIAQQKMAEMVKVLGETESVTEPTPGPIPSVKPSPLVEPTLEPAATVYYGVGGLYDAADYRLEINSPRLVTESGSTSSRKLVIDLVLYNKNVINGLNNQLSATIIKDGVVIVPNAAMSISEAKTVFPKEKITYQAKLSLIEGTDVKEVHFKPLGVAPINHQLLP